MVGEIVGFHIIIVSDKNIVYYRILFTSKYIVSTVTENSFSYRLATVVALTRRAEVFRVIAMMAWALYVPGPSSYHTYDW